MRRFIEVTYNGDTVLLNLEAIQMVSPRRSNDGTNITVLFGVPNTEDATLHVTENYDQVKAKIHAAVH